MSYSVRRLGSLFALPLGALLSLAGHAQQAAPPPPPPPPAATAPAAAAAPPASLSSSLGVFVFPAKDQSSTQQSTDEGACYGWAKSQTGIDPMNISAPQAAAQPSQADASNSGGGERVKGAARGAAAGAAIGAIAGDAGTGAAAGAAAGTMAGGAAKRRGQKEAAAQQQQQQAAAAQQQQAAIAQQKATYNKAFSACMEGKGYTVK
jgi:hypothetical protein